MGKEHPLSIALLERDKYDEMSCDGTFWYLWTVDKLREILGENTRKEMTFVDGERIKELKEEQREQERKLVHLKSGHECREMMVEALKTKGRLTSSGNMKRRKEIGLILKEDVEQKDTYLKLFVKFREVSKSLEALELAKLTKLQSLIPNKYMKEGGIDMTEDSKIGEIMEVITESWKDVGAVV
jgi:hypothetical protein